MFANALVFDAESRLAGLDHGSVSVGYCVHYEYLRMLRDRVTDLEQEGAEGELLDEARKLLTSAADRVTGCMTESPRIMWQTSKDRSVADTVRLEILEMLTRLQGR